MSPSSELPEKQSTSLPENEGKYFSAPKFWWSHGEAILGWKSLVRFFVALTLLGGLYAFHIPVSQIASGIAFLIGVGFIVKFVGDNRELYRQVGRRPFLSAMLRTWIVFIPVIVLLLPGVYLGSKVQAVTLAGADRIDEWTRDPEVFSKYVEMTRAEVKRTVKKNVPWYLKPAQYLGRVPKDEEITEIIMVPIIHLPLWAKAAAGMVKAALTALGIYSTFWLVVLFLRAYSMLFGRIIVVGREPLSFRIGGSSLSAEKLEVSHAFGSQYVLKQKEGEAFFVRKNYAPTNAPPKLNFAFGNGARWARLRNDLIFMNRIEAGKMESEVSFLGSHSTHFVTVDLEGGQSLAVDLAHVVGYSATVRFKSHWNLNLCRLALHRALVVTVHGPGRILLLCKGQPAVYAGAAGVPSLDMARMIAWSDGATLKIEGSDGFLDYYASGCYVRPTDGDIFIWEPGEVLKRSFFPVMWKLIRQTYLPI